MKNLFIVYIKVADCKNSVYGVYEYEAEAEWVCDRLASQMIEAWVES